MQVKYACAYEILTSFNQWNDFWIILSEQWQMGGELRKLKFQSIWKSARKRLSKRRNENECGSDEGELRLQQKCYMANGTSIEAGNSTDEMPVLLQL